MVKKKGMPADTYLKNYIRTLNADEAKSWESVYKVVESTQKEYDDLDDLEIDLETELELDETIDADCVGDFESLNCSGELRILGLHSAKDFPENSTVSEIGRLIDNWYRSYKISGEACDELVEFLKEKGYGVKSDDSVEPEFDLLPHMFLHPDRRDDLEHQQIRNYFHTVFPDNKEYGPSTEVNADREKDLYYEDGYYYVGGEGTCDRYEGQCTGQICPAESYPYNLLNDILGYTNAALMIQRFEPLPVSLIETIDNVLSTLTSDEEKWIRLYYQYGPHAALKALNLPEWPTLLWGIREVNLIRKGIRKLRHPSRFKKLKGYLNQHPLAPTEHHRSVYNEFVKDIAQKVRECAQSGITLRKAFSPFYSEEIVDRIEENKNKWMLVQQVDIEDIELPWNVYSPLVQSGVKTLKNLWDKHHRSIPLGDYQHSGLRHIYGLHKDEILLLFEVMERYRLELLDPQYAQEVVQYAETLACGNNDCGIDFSRDNGVLPDFACASVPIMICKYLLRAGYRRRADIIRDYYNNQLREKFAASGESTFVWGQLENVVYSLATGRFPTRMFFSADKWDSVLDRNPGVSFSDLRQKYLFGNKINGNPFYIESNISLLFPIRNVGFDLLHKTRNRELHWITWPSILLEKSDLLTGKLHESFFGTNGRVDHENENYLLVKYAEESKEQIAIYRFANTENESFPKLCELHEMEQLAQEVSMNLYRAVLLNAELFSDPGFGSMIQDGQSLKGQVSTVFEAAQKGFCRYCSAQSDEIQQMRWFDSYCTKPMNEMMWRWFRMDGVGPETLIEDLELTIRSYNCLKRAGYSTLGDLIPLRLEDYMKIRNLGKKSLMEIEGKLAAIGYPIKSDQ